MCERFDFINEIAVHAWHAIHTLYIIVAGKEIGLSPIIY